MKKMTCAFVRDFSARGLVFQHRDGRMAKIRRTDCGVVGIAPGGVQSRRRAWEIEK